ncbi:kinase-like domain-containing protein [Glomus cerebriforme]|uniref:Kinase-like domain-containing protein n=1 Tax=Glomus cerebriforme TaxID=658196 RepID=A0A397SND6_9GLOM|nr:kinase-like domain-containing protein [Glomus cerebriforme]
METFRPDMIVEWIPYNNFQNIKYLTKGGCSEIYTAIWTDGPYNEWDFKEHLLKRFGSKEVILKGLGNIMSSCSWYEEAKSHLTISNKWASIVHCYGLTQDPSNKDYILVMLKMDMDLRNYLRQNHNQLTWEGRIQITIDIINALYRIHLENAIHRDLHSGNILYSQLNQRFCISDLGFCGPAGKQLKGLYGNLPYTAPEVIIGKEHTFASDIYSIAILMWEISSGQPPFMNYEHDYDLAMNIVNGIRPKIVSEIPLEYKNLMEQCWDADPLKRPDTFKILKKMDEINLNYQKIPIHRLEANINLKINELSDLKVNYTSNTNKIYQFPEPRNATEGINIYNLFINF